MENKEFRKQISDDLLRLGLKPGGVVMVHSHSSLWAPVPGGIQTVIDGILDALGPKGTLLMPGLSWIAVDRDHPGFDVRSTPSCVGAIPEYFRNLPGTIRSMHPTHSVCGQGPMATRLFDGHIRDTTPCGANSPFHKLRFHRGQVLMLGCGLLRNTMIHAVEETAAAPYLFEKESLEYTLTDYDGTVTKAAHCRHAEFPQHFDRVRAGLIGNGLSEGKVLQALCHLYDAEALWNHASAMLQEDILCFVKD